MDNQEKAQIAVAGVGLLMVVAAGLNYAKIAREERSKRAKIKEWELENLSCIENYRSRITSMLSDPGCSLSEILQVMREEAQFLNVVRNQPPY